MNLKTIVILVQEDPADEFDPIKAQMAKSNIELVQRWVLTQQLSLQCKRESYCVLRKKFFLFSYRELSHQPVVGCNYLQPIRLQQFQKWLSLLGCLKLRVTTKLTTVGKAEIRSLIWLSVTSETDVGVQTGRPSLVHSGAIVPLRASLNLSEMSEEEVDRRLTQVWILKYPNYWIKNIHVW